MVNSFCLNASWSSCVLKRAVGREKVSELRSVGVLMRTFPDIGSMTENSAATATHHDGRRWGVKGVELQHGRV